MTPSEARKLLNINTNASIKEIKTRFKKMAMKHHPDRDGGDAIKFKKIKQASEILISNHGAYIVTGNANKIDPNFVVEVDKSVIGKEILVRVPIISFCGGCSDGMVTGSTVKLCNTCKGVGKINGVKCGQCLGKGKIVLNPCKRCNGTNYCNYYQKKKIVISKEEFISGFKELDEIKSVNRSSCRINIVKPDSKEQSGRKRRAADVVNSININLYTAIFGGKIKTEYNHSEIIIKIRAGTQCGDKIVQDVDGQMMEFTAKILIPINLSLSEKKTLKAALYGSLNR